MVRFTTPFGKPRRPSSAACIRLEKGGGGSAASSSGAPQSQHQTETTVFHVVSSLASLAPVAAHTRQRLGLEVARSCAVCEHPFPPAALLGRISCKAIVEQRARWGITTLKRRDIAPGTLYDERRVCVFCAQFFDEEVMWLDAADDEAEAASTQRTRGSPSPARGSPAAHLRFRGSSSSVNALLNGSFADSAGGLSTPGRATMTDATASQLSRTPQSSRPGPTRRPASAMSGSRVAAPRTPSDAAAGSDADEPTDSTLPPTPSTADVEPRHGRATAGPMATRIGVASVGGGATNGKTSEAHRRRLEDAFCLRVLQSAAAERQRQKKPSNGGRGAAASSSADRRAGSGGGVPLLSASLRSEFGPAHAASTQHHLENRKRRAAASPVLEPTVASIRGAPSHQPTVSANGGGGGGPRRRMSHGGTHRTRAELLERARSRMRSASPAPAAPPPMAEATTPSEL